MSPATLAWNISTPDSGGAARPSHGRGESLKANYAAQSIRVVVPTVTARKWARPKEGAEAQHLSHFRQP